MSLYLEWNTKIKYINGEWIFFFKELEDSHSEWLALSYTIIIGIQCILHYMYSCSALPIFLAHFSPNN